MTHVDGGSSPVFPTLSRGGDRAAIVHGNAVEIYDLPGSRLIRTIVHSAAISAVAFASTGYDLVSGDVDGSVLVTRDGREPIALPRSVGGIDSAAFVADGRVVISNLHSQLRIYDLNHNTVIADLAAPTRVRALRPSPDGHHLITIPSYAGKAAPPVLWDLERYRRIAQLEGHLGQVFSVRFIGGGGEILTAGGDGTTRMWDSATGRLRQTYRGGSRFLADAAVSPDGAIVAAGGADGLLRFWDAATARPLWALPAHRGRAGCTAGRSQGRRAAPRTGRRSHARRRSNRKLRGHALDHGSILLGLALSESGLSLLEGLGLALGLAMRNRVAPPPPV